MHDQETMVTLSIRETGTVPQRGLLMQEFVDGDAVDSNRAISPAEWRASRNFARRYLALFGHGGRPQIAAEQLQALGDELFANWLAPL